MMSSIFLFYHKTLFFTKYKIFDTKALSYKLFLKFLSFFLYFQMLNSLKLNKTDCVSFTKV